MKTSTNLIYSLALVILIIFTLAPDVSASGSSRVRWQRCVKANPPSPPGSSQASPPHGAVPENVAEAAAHLVSGGTPARADAGTTAAAPQAGPSGSLGPVVDPSPVFGQITGGLGYAEPTILPVHDGPIYDDRR